MRRPLTGYTPKVSVILPCKGLDPGFDANIKAVFEQDYPDFEIIFATAGEDDEACPAIRRLMTRYAHVPAKLVHAGFSSERGQKVNNQLRALREIRPDTEVLAFVDSDGRPARDFLRNLIDPLHDTGTVATTGFRWYVPVGGGFGSWLRSAWNAGGIIFLSHPKCNYVWGGAMAIRRETFAAANVEAEWRYSLSDDMGLTRALRNRPGRIRFVPRCLVASTEDSTLRQTVEWTNRQTIIARVYTRDFWTLSGLTYAAGFAFLMLGIDGFVHARSAALSAAFLLPFLGGLMTSPFILSAARQMLRPPYRERVVRGMPIYLAVAPLAAILFLVNTLVSIFRSQITWRGATYRLHGNGRISVLSG